MGNLIPAERIYEGVSIDRATNSIISFRGLATGLVRELHVWVGGFSTEPSRSASFRVRHNGVAIGNKIGVANDEELHGQLTGKAIAAELGDLWQLDLVDRGESGTILAPITFLLITEEGE